MDKKEKDAEIITRKENCSPRAELRRVFLLGRPVQ